MNLFERGCRRWAAGTFLQLHSLLFLPWAHLLAWALGTEVPPAPPLRRPCVDQYKHSGLQYAVVILFFIFLLQKSLSIQLNLMHSSLRQGVKMTATGGGGSS